MLVQDEHAEALEGLVPCGRQREPIGAPEGLLVGIGQEVEHDRKVGRAARHRTDDREVAFERERWGRVAGEGGSANVGLWT